VEVGIQSRQAAQLVGLQAAFSIGLDSCGGAISASDSNLESGPNSEGRSRLDLYPDERVQGWIPFTLEDGAIPAKLKYELNVFNGETVEVDLSGTLEIVDWEPIQPSLDAPSLGDTNIVFGYSLAALSSRSFVTWNSLHTQRWCSLGIYRNLSKE
jgi:hypothetical protein